MQNVDHLTQQTSKSSLGSFSALASKCAHALINGAAAAIGCPVDTDAVETLSAADKAKLAFKI